MKRQLQIRTQWTSIAQARRDMDCRAVKAIHEYRHSQKGRRDYVDRARRIDDGQALGADNDQRPPAPCHRTRVAVPIEAPSLNPARIDVPSVKVFDFRSERLHS